MWVSIHCPRQSHSLLGLILPQFYPPSTQKHPLLACHHPLPPPTLLSLNLPVPASMRTGFSADRPVHVSLLVLLALESLQWIATDSVALNGNHPAQPSSFSYCEHCKRFCKLHLRHIICILLKAFWVQSLEGGKRIFSCTRSSSISVIHFLFLVKKLEVI